MSPRSTPTLDEQLGRACEAMVRYAFASGLAVPETVADVVQRAGGAGESRPDVRQLTRAHNELVRIVAPATPRTILVVAEGRKSALSMLGPVRLVRQMLVVVIVLLVAFLLLASSQDVNETGGDFFHSAGVPVLVNGLFYLVAGGLGAAFSALFTAQRYIKDGVYDPKYESTYWLRFILGLMAGLLLPALVPLAGDGEAGAVTRPLLALLGGFSASVLYRVLERLVTTVETLVRSDPRQLRSAEQEVVAARTSEQSVIERLALVGDLRRLQDQARSGGDGQLADRIEQLVAGLLPAPLENGTTPGGTRAGTAGD